MKRTKTLEQWIAEGNKKQLKTNNDPTQPHHGYEDGGIIQPASPACNPTADDPLAIASSTLQTIKKDLGRTESEWWTFLIHINTDSMDGWCRITLAGGCRVMTGAGLLLLNEVSGRSIWMHCGWLLRRQNVPNLKFIHPSLGNLICAGVVQILDSIVELLSMRGSEILYPLSYSNRIFLDTPTVLVIKYFLIHTPADVSY